MIHDEGRRVSDPFKARLLTKCFILVGSAMLGSTLTLVRSVGLTYFLEHRKMVVWKLIVRHQIIVSVAEMSYKMASRLCQKWFLRNSGFFVQKLKFCTFRTIRFILQISPACSPKVSNNVWRDFRLTRLAFATVARKIFKG